MRYGIHCLLWAVVLLACFSACGRTPARYVNVQHGRETVVSVWIDPKSGLPLEETLAGCNYWNEMDVRCVAARNVVEADVAVMLDHHPCSPNERGTKAVAFASPYRVISMRLDCFYDTERGSGFDAEQYRSVIAHEVGHEIGIWDHVPLECDDKAVVVDGMRLCGQAIMNPLYDDKVKYLTPVDAVAFGQRTRVNTVVPRRASVRREDCVLTAAPK